MAPVKKTPPRRGLRQNWAVNFALLPMAVTVLLCYVGTVLWSITISLTSSKTFPTTNFVGLAQYERLFTTERWALSLHNMALFGAIFVVSCLVLGFLLAVFIDQKVRGEGVLRTIFLYPYAMSFVATGLVWQWMLNPGLGLQQAVRQLGFPGFEFDWIISQDKVMYAIALAAVWQSAGLVMALMLAGLRGVDEEIWKAARIDGIPVWRVYLSIVLPMIAPSIATASVLLSLAVIKVFDVVVAMTGGGPGIASEVPAKFIMDYLFNRANIGLASAASVLLLLTVLALLLPWMYAKNRMERAQTKGH
ncbi:glucose/mannose transport system permease protein [Rhodoferax ferrireducens]|uniref:Glucose/mannose transport system permease protein n=1 Tax=Rhodoferax ferrireducens TaxID=192843 RepID=A0ABU2C7W7_9BURK|nr:sugar ABC transporter permease [Rhodoferax ferrireducens]MDR7377425.1 glucose/mannose transport system permease protein [Rhodoferax ferrireducens]